MIHELAEKNRSYRRFHHDRKIDESTLLSFIDNARISSCGGNKQEIRYVTVTSEENTAKVFSSLKWAQYFELWQPTADESPSAYILLLKKGGNAGIDDGIAAEAITLSAAEEGIGCCMLLNADKKKIAEDLDLGDEYQITLVIALGYPSETVRIVPVENNDIKYYRDENDIHCVPKRALQDVVIARK